MKLAKCSVFLTILALSLTACTAAGHAQVTLSVTLNPSTPLPGDIVKGELTIKTGLTPETISGVTFYSPLPVEPQSVSGIGSIPANSYYTLPFTLKAISPGTYVVKIYVSTTNGTVVQSFNVNVASAKPEVVISEPITLGEVNSVHFVLYNPINAYGVRVTPLFKAYPSTIYVVNNEGSFRFYPTKSMPLKFRIEFYDGFATNYHSYVQTVYPSYRNSSGVSVNVSTPHSTYMLFDVIPLSISITNLRTDTIYDLSVKVSTRGFEKTETLPYLNPSTTEKVVVNCPASKAGNETARVLIKYRDYLGNHYETEKVVTFKVLPSEVVSISDVSVERSGSGFEITGDISNSGWSKVYGVTVTASSNGKNVSYFVGTIDPSDYDTFDIVASNATKIIVTWQDIIGETHSVSETLHLVRQPVKVKESNAPLLVSAIGAVVIFAIVLVAVLRRSRGGERKSQFGR